MEVHGVTGDEHSLGDLPVRETLGDEVRDGALGVGESGETQHRPSRSAGFILEMHDHTDGNSAVEDRLASQGHGAAVGQDDLDTPADAPAMTCSAC